jgi:hypothetical protein
MNSRSLLSISISLNVLKAADENESALVQEQQVTAEAMVSPVAEERDISVRSSDAVTGGESHPCVVAPGSTVTAVAIRCETFGSARESSGSATPHNYRDCWARSHWTPSSWHSDRMHYGYRQGAGGQKHVLVEKPCAYGIWREEGSSVLHVNAVWC